MTLTRIMVVDDDPNIRNLVRTILEHEGYEVVEAENGRACLDMLHKGERPDLILLDVMMPEMDGWEVSRRIKGDEELSSIPVCMLTAKSTTMDALMSLESAHADWHINKPISKKLLLEGVGWLLGSASQ
ncbi:MAG: response regulator [Methanobacteriota archaeon]|nr:MAG: response regulator [Euryarchaeota archaeon]